MADLPSILGTDQPQSPERTKDLGDILAEAVRALNYATRDDAPGLEQPADLDAVIQALATMTQRLPQLLDQLGDWLAEQHAEGRLEVNHGPLRGRPDEAVVQAQSWLTDAREAAGELHRHLDGARQVTATIGAVYDPTEDPDA